MNTFYVYILTNKTNTVLYTGMTRNISRRLNIHFNGSSKSSFSYRYKLNKLVYIEIAENWEAAYSREHQIKGGSRKKKIALINSINPEWINLEFLI